ncbi:MAG: HEAT repeat domain-containing protein [Planctomycetota bacterium]
MKTLPLILCGIFFLLPGCPTSIEGHLEDLKAEDPEDRLDAAVALGEERAVQAVKALEDRLARDDAPLVRAACARALVRIGRPSSTKALVRALDDKRWMVRWEAVMGLGRLRDQTSAEKIVALLREDPSHEVRRECAKVLGHLGATETIPALIEALSDRNDTVRIHAELALRQLTCQDIGPRRSDWETWYEEFQKRMKKVPE